MIDRAIAAVIVALVVVGIVFAFWPSLDLDVSRYIYEHGGFWGSSAAARAARDGLRLAPYWLLGGLVLLTLARRLWPRLPAPSVAALVYLVASLVIGPGLIVNLGLKDHMHRPRPVHVTEFGGKDAFRPWDRDDGACVKNCAFASGEAASGFWTIAPALLAPPPFQAAAIAAALVFGVATSALRVAFGGHFLSDVLFGGLISTLVLLALWKVYRRRL